jgi:hypothetical protein
MTQATTQACLSPHNIAKKLIWCAHAMCGFAKVLQACIYTLLYVVHELNSAHANVSKFPVAGYPHVVSYGRRRGPGASEHMPPDPNLFYCEKPNE